MIKFVKTYNEEGRQEEYYDKYFKLEGLISKLVGSHAMHLPPCNPRLASSPGAAVCRKSKKNDGQVDAVLAFLDHQFNSGDIDQPGDDAHIRYTKISWCLLYEGYLDYCKTLSLPPVHYNKFVTIRCVVLLKKLHLRHLRIFIFSKTEREHYQKHRCTRASGWDHLDCQVCNTLEREVLSRTNMFRCVLIVVVIMLYVYADICAEARY